MTTAASTPAQESDEDPNPITIGVLALQGDYEAHARAFANAGARTVLVRKPEELKGLDGLVLPGGESTTMLKFLEGHGFFDSLGEFVAITPCFATCAGCILVAREVLHPKQRSLGVLDATVERNAYGRQVDSTILTLPTELPGGPLEMVFIRAPRITRVGPGVKVLAQRDGFPALVRQGKLLAATFHPEMTTDTRVQQLFLEMVRRHKKVRRQSETVTTSPAHPDDVTP
jgi:pyridoxal 5'-phosphate synthase pdxT subunit